MADHYFTAQPASPGELRAVEVTIAGRQVTVHTAAGVFSPDHVDLGTRVLLRTVADPPATGHLLDLGCGWGPLTLTMATLSPMATVWAVDVNQRALDLVRRNAADLNLTNVVAAAPEAVPEEIAFAAIWSNPPIRVGKAALHGLLATWLAHLADDGAADLVVQRNLGADSLQAWLAENLPVTVHRAASAKGFRVLHVTPDG